MSTRPRTPGHGAPAPGKLPITDLLGMKASRSPIAMITAYDAPSGRLADAAGVDMILVGDSAAMTVLGHDSTVPATMEEMLVLTRAVTRGARRPLIVADMPFGSFQVSDELAVDERDPVRQGCRRRRRQARGRGADALRARAIVGAGVPVMGHIGLTPQSATALGGFKAQGRTAAKAAQLVRDALALEAGRLLLRSCSRPSRRRSRRRSPSCSRSRRSASAPAPASTARCSSGMTSSASTTAMRRGS